MSKTVTRGIKRSLKWFRSAYWLHNVLWVGLWGVLLWSIMPWWRAIPFSMMIFYISYSQGERAANRLWKPRYDKLWDHHREGLRQSSSKIVELQTQLGAKKGVVAPHV